MISVGGHYRDIGVKVLDIQGYRGTYSRQPGQLEGPSAAAELDAQRETGRSMP